MISAFNPGWSNPRHLQLAGQGHASHYRRMKKAKVKRRLFIVGAGSLEVKPGVPSSAERMPSSAAEYQMVVVYSPADFMVDTCRDKQVSDRARKFGVS